MTTSAKHMSVEDFADSCCKRLSCEGRRTCLYCFRPCKHYCIHHCCQHVAHHPRRFKSLFEYKIQRNSNRECKHESCHLKVSKLCHTYCNLHCCKRNHKEELDKYMKEWSKSRKYKSWNSAIAKVKQLVVRRQE